MLITVSLVATHSGRVADTGVLTVSTHCYTNVEMFCRDEHLLHLYQMLACVSGGAMTSPGRNVQSLQRHLIPRLGQGVMQYS